MTKKEYLALTLTDKVKICKNNKQLLSGIKAQVDPHCSLNNYTDSQWAELGECVYLFGRKLVG